MNTRFTAPAQGVSENCATYFGFDAMTLFGSTLDLETVDGAQASIRLPVGTTQALIPPGGKTTRPLRRAWEKAGNLVIGVADDNSPPMGGCRGPDGFDPVTLKWALRFSDNIVLWGCGLEDHVVANVQAIISRAKPTLLIVTHEPQELSWFKFINKWRRSDSTLTMLMSDGGSFDCLFGRSRNVA